MKTKEKQKGSDKLVLTGKSLSKEAFIAAVKDAGRGRFYSVDESKKCLHNGEKNAS